MKYTTFLLLILACNCWAQGPQVSYYYNPSTELSWAQCYVYQGGGSRQRIPFLPAIAPDRSPVGTLKYTRNINVNGIIAFVGNGIVGGGDWNSYAGRRADNSVGEIDLTGKIAMMCYDFPDSTEGRFGSAFPTERRITIAAAHRANAVVLFSHKNPYPFRFLTNFPDSAVPSIPVITISESSAVAILESGGVNGREIMKEWEKSGRPPESQVLISKLSLAIKGAFQKVETSHFSFHFRKEEFSVREMGQIAGVNEKAYRCIVKLFKDIAFEHKGLFIVYFRDYDSKVFYTHHWGKGLAADAGIFNVHEGGVPSFGLAVHEDTHLLWGAGATSFLNEGIAMYAEAFATDKDKNNRTTAANLRAKKLYPLKEMMTFQIGIPGDQTDIGYPASGSFVGFLIETHGLKLFRDVFILERRPEAETKTDDSWMKIYNKSLLELEEQWHDWLTK